MDPTYSEFCFSAVQLLASYFKLIILDNDLTEQEIVIIDSTCFWFVFFANTIGQYTVFAENMLHAWNKHRYVHS